MNDIHIPGQMLQMHRLVNGLQIIGQPMPDAESVALAYYVPTGSRDEVHPSLEGISHFLEHMLFKGTATLDRHQLDQEFTRIGAKRNGFTSIETTFYYIQVLPEHVERGMELLSAMMYPRLLEQEFAKDKIGVRWVMSAGSNKALEFLKNRSRMMVTFAPLGQTGVYAPIHATVGTQIGPLTISARRFEAVQ